MVFENKAHTKKKKLFTISFQHIKIEYKSVLMSICKLIGENNKSSIETIKIIMKAL